MPGRNVVETVERRRDTARCDGSRAVGYREGETGEKRRKKKNKMRGRKERKSGKEHGR